MRRINGLFILILILAATASGLVFWRLFLYQPPAPAEISGPTPTPVQFILPSPAPFQEGKGESATDLFRSLKERFPLAAFLPYQTEAFSIDYTAPLSLKVEIREASQAAQIKKDVLEWISSHGVDPATHQIRYFIPAP